MDHVVNKGSLQKGLWGAEVAEIRAISDGSNREKMAPMTHAEEGKLREGRHGIKMIIDQIPLVSELC